MKKRDVFAEIVEGFDALKAQRKGKATLRTHTVNMPEPADVTATEVRPNGEVDREVANGSASRSAFEDTWNMVATRAKP